MWWFSLATAPAAADTPEGHSLPFEATWLTGTTDLEVTLSGPDGEWVSVEVRASLGPLRHAWTTPAVWIDGNASATIGVPLPPEAYLDPAADRWVTRLRSRLILRPAPEAGSVSADLPVRYALWSSGPSALPEALSEDEMRVRAPCGTLEPVELPPELAGFVCRAEPPIEDRRPAGPPPVQRPRTSVPEDDQSDEVVR